MSFDPTPSQALLIFGLLARHGECPQAELMPAVDRADREALVKAKLVTAEKVGRALYLKLEDAGWAWAASNFGAELPPAQQALSDILRRLEQHLVRSGETLAAFIGAKPATSSAPKAPIPKAKTKPKAKAKGAKRPSVAKPGPVAKKKPASKAKDNKAQSPKSPTPAAVRNQIETAYLAATGGRKDEGVKLSRLRRELSDLDRPTVDAALARILKGDKKASLARDDNTRQLDQSDHDAAFSPSGEPFHIIWISS